MKTLLVCALAAVIAFALDSYRPPNNQLTARGYCALVCAYQTNIGPLTRKWVRCRFQPTCTEYSIEAVKRCGIRRGLILTVARLHRCQRNVPLGTRDPVANN